MGTEAFAYQSEFTERLRDEGRSEGLVAGRVQAMADAELRTLRVRGVLVPGPARERIEVCTDPDLLDVWHDRAVTAVSIDDLGI